MIIMIVLWLRTIVLFQQFPTKKGTYSLRMGGGGAVKVIAVDC